MKFRQTVALLCAVATLITAPAIGSAVRAAGIAEMGQANDVQGAGPTVPVAQGPLAAGADLAEAMRLEQAIDWHLWYRQGYEINYVDTTRNPGVGGTDPATRYPGIASIGGAADSALWTGTYLASQSFRYQVAKNYLAIAKGTDKKFWQGQKDEALSRIKSLIDQYHLLSHISKEWKWTEADDAKHTPGISGNQKFIDAGTAPFKEAGEGLLFRACIPDGARLNPWHKNPNATYAAGEGPFLEDRVYGPFPYAEPGSSKVTMYDCEDGTSRDAYAGTSFGMATAFDFVDRDDLWVKREDGTKQNLHDQVGDDLRLMTQFLLDNHWTTPRPHSKVSTSNDLSSFISPLYVTSTGGRQHLLQIARHVAKVMGTPDAASFEAEWQKEMTTNGFGNTGGSIVDTMAPTDSYYKWNLGHLVAYGLLRLEPNDAASKSERDRLRGGVGIMDASTRDDINAHFETVTYALTGEPARRDAAIEHLRDWRLYRAKLDDPAAHPDLVTVSSGVIHVNNYGICNDPGLPLSADATCKPEDKNQNDAYVPTPAGIVHAPPVYKVCNATTRDAQPNVTGPCRSVDPLPVAKRSPTDFLWQRPPFDLDGDEGITHEPAGFDYLLPYWMLRYYTEVSPPTTVEPFPEWVGPRYQ